MAATFTWQIEHCERTASDGAVFFVRWKCDASETQGEGSNAITHNKECWGTTTFTPDSSSSDFVQFSDLTEEEILTWVWSENLISKEDIETGLQDQLTEEFSPTIAEGLPW